LGTLPKEVKIDLTRLFQSKGDKCHYAIGVLLWSFVSHGRAVAVISCDDLERLIEKAWADFEGFPVDNAFKVRSGQRGTVWRQMTAALIETEAMTILKHQEKNMPAVVELTSLDWLSFIPNTPTDDLRLSVINSTSKTKFASIADYKNSLKV